jgi:hemerythrin-like domain-containing protein
MTHEHLSEESSASRRQFLRGASATAAGAALVFSGCQAAGKSGKEAEEGEKVTPGEDLMQEHGVLKRILLIYGEGIRRLGSNEDLPADAIHKSALLVRSFVEDYHEQQEEQYLFPRLKKAGKQVELVEVLLEQHRAGRRVTDRIVQMATDAGLRDASQRRDLVTQMQQFIRMYSVHEAREDTVLFPAFRDLVSKQEYEDLGEMFEKNEQKHFGADGFDLAVDQVTAIEKSLGIYELAQFTPKI